jgi:hypothetical protein
MTVFFKSHEITIYRQKRIGSSNRYSMSATFTGCYADIQPESRPERLENAQGRFGTTWTAYIDEDVDIKEGDQVVDGQGKRYSVTGVIKWQGAGLLSHQELTLVSKDGN